MEAMEIISVNAIIRMVKRKLNKIYCEAVEYRTVD